jgi:ATP-dependent DNA ligase
MFKIKHVRTADCVVAGFRWHKNGHGTLDRLAAARAV